MLILTPTMVGQVVRPGLVVNGSTTEVWDLDAVANTFVFATSALTSPTQTALLAAMATVESRALAVRVGSANGPASALALALDGSTDTFRMVTQYVDYWTVIDESGEKRYRTLDQAMALARALAGL